MPLISIMASHIVITADLLEFDLDIVRRGDPTLPFALAWIGYPALLILTALFAARFLHAFQGGQTAAEQGS